MATKRPNKKATLRKEICKITSTDWYLRTVQEMCNTMFNLFKRCSRAELNQCMRLDMSALNKNFRSTVLGSTTPVPVWMIDQSCPLASATLK